MVFSRENLSELELPASSWPSLLPTIQSVLYNSPSQQREASITIFQGRELPKHINIFIGRNTATLFMNEDAICEASFNLEEGDFVLVTR